MKLELNVSESQGNVGFITKDGQYICQIINVDTKLNKAGNATLVVVHWACLAPSSDQGKRVLQYFVYRSNNPQVEQIGQRRLKQLFDLFSIGDYDTDKLIGQFGLLSVEMKTLPDGRMMANVKTVQKLPEEIVEKLK